MTRRILGRAAAAKKAGLTWPRMIQLERKGKFPSRVETPNGYGWLEHEIETWLADRLPRS